MSTKKDMRRSDLIIPYQAPPPKDGAGDFSGTLSNSMPMAAMFMRNRMIGWASVVMSIQNWLSESEESRASSSQPAIFSVGMAFLALVVTYLPMFLPPPGSPVAVKSPATPSAVPIA
ncbi:hypothetical protein B7463_g1855, partial [Scytalidium lignicola]